MRILVLGGTGFLGTPLSEQLRRQGHEVAVFHRGLGCRVSAPLHIHGDRCRLEASYGRFRDFAPEVVIDAIASSAAAARRVLRVFAPPPQADSGSGLAVRRIVLISSIDVYRAGGVFHGTEPGCIEPAPLREDSAVRTSMMHAPSSLARLRALYTWIEGGFDKLGMERAAAACVHRGRVTIVRLGQLYGPGDHQHRLYAYWGPMAQGRPVVFLQQGWAQWRSPRIFVGNAAAGIAMAALAPRAAGRVYNLSEAGNFSELEWTCHVGRRAGWCGRVVITPPALTPPHLRVAANTAQALALDSSRIRRELGYREIVPLDAALDSTLAWERERPPAPGPDAAAERAAEDDVLFRLGLASPLRRAAAARAEAHAEAHAEAPERPAPDAPVPAAGMAYGRDRVPEKV